VNKMRKALNAYKGMTIRNVKVYMKNKMTIIMSMMAQIIILGLFVLFLRQTYTDSVKSALDQLQNLLSDNDINAIINSWMVSGVIGTSVITVALNSLSVMVEDKEKKISYDYGASPVKGYIVVLSYFTGAVINTFIVSAILLTLGLIFLTADGTISYSVTDLLRVYGLTALGTVSATIILMFIASFFKKNSTHSAFGVMVSAAIGFIIGAYIPVSEFDSSVQTAVNLVPGSQIAGMIRNTLMVPAIDNADNILNGADKGIFAETVTKAFSINMNIFDNEISFNFMMIYSLIAIAIFLILNLAVYKFTAKSKG